MNRANRGYSLVEVLIAGVIMAFLFAAVFVLVFQGGSTYANASRSVSLQRNAREVLERIAAELRYANPDTLFADTLTPGEGTITYEKSIGFNQGSGVTTWSTPITIELEVSNVDANNNGIAGKADVDIDDRRLTRTQNLPVKKPDGSIVIEPVKAILCDYVKKYDPSPTTPVEKRGGFTVTKTETSPGMFRVKLEITLAVFDESNTEMLTKVSTSVVLRKQSAP